MDDDAEGLTWRMHSRANRFTGRFSDDRSVIAGHWELLGDTGDWQPWMEIHADQAAELISASDLSGSRITTGISRPPCRWKPSRESLSEVISFHRAGLSSAVASPPSPRTCHLRPGPEPSDPHRFRYQAGSGFAPPFEATMTCARRSRRAPGPSGGACTVDPGHEQQGGRLPPGPVAPADVGRDVLADVLGEPGVPPSASSTRPSVKYVW